MEDKRILFISYYFPPYNSVGVKRIAYWFDNIHQYNIVPLVFTAIPQEKNREDILHVEPKKSKNPLAFLIKDEGVNWIKALKQQLVNYKENEFDFILISGGPFMQMLITKYLKQNFKAKIILDFRDPFYANPRFNSSFLKDKVKYYFQKQFLKYADIVITVNEQCKKLISHSSIHLIDNGFDENILLNQAKGYEHKPTDNLQICATGRVYDDVNIDPFFEIIDSDKRLSFSYIGNQRFAKYENLYLHCGFLPYNQAIDFIMKSDLCILFTGGLAFESSTKIFDYLGLNKIILIITEGVPKTGTLQQITQAYPNVFWAQNEFSAIRLAIDKISEHEIVMVDTSEFSRAKGLEKLVKILSL